MELKLSTLTISGSLIQGENPQPRLCDKAADRICKEDGTLSDEERIGYGIGCTQRTLPYRMQDRYSRGKGRVTLKTIVLENSHLKAVFLPEYGGKLWSLFSKDEARELLYVNPVFRPCNLANRNAWTAGGIEWNLGHTGHFAFTCDNLFCAKMKAEDGEVFLRMYEYEASHKQVLQMDFHLPDGAKQLALHVRIENAVNTQAPLYWWTNTAASLTETTRVFSGTPEILYQVKSDANNLHYDSFGHTQMPIQPNLKNVDVSYPWMIPHSIEYFFQNKRTGNPWEVCIEGDCKGFAERSTARMFARKLFCWGTGTGGRHWCDYLAKKGKGNYVELQAGLAPTQLHTAVLPAGEAISFTQVFGAFTAPKQAQALEWNAALPFVEQAVEETIPAQGVQEMDREYGLKAVIAGGELLHMGSGYGALEQARRSLAGEAPMAAHLSFPLPQENSEFYHWYGLLHGKPLPNTEKPLVYLTDSAWLPILKASIKNGGDSEQALFQYAVMLAENHKDEDSAKILNDLVERHNNPWAAYLMGFLEKRRNNMQAYVHWLVLAYKLENNSLDPSFAECAIEALLSEQNYDKAWEIFCDIPEEKQTETEVLLISQAAVKLEQFEFLEKAFAREYASIREGAVGLADIWLEYKARLACKEKGVPFTEEAIDPALALPLNLNFRMLED